MSRIVIDRFAGHGPDPADVIGDRAEVWKQLAQFHAGRAETTERELGSVAGQLLPLELRNLAARGEGFRHRLPVHLGQPGFGIEGFQMGRSAGHREPDHPPGLRDAVKGLDHARPAIVGRCGAQGLRPQQGREGECPHSLRSAAQEDAARLVLSAGLQPFLKRGPVHGQARVMVSCRFSRTRATLVHAARVAGSRSSGAGNAPVRSRRIAASGSAL